MTSTSSGRLAGFQFESEFSKRGGQGDAGGVGCGFAVRRMGGRRDGDAVGARGVAHLFGGDIELHFVGALESGEIEYRKFAVAADEVGEGGQGHLLVFDMQVAVLARSDFGIARRPGGGRRPARSDGDSALDGALGCFRRGLLGGGRFETGAAVGYYQCVYVEVAVFAVKAHAEALRQQGLHHGWYLPAPAAFGQSGLNIVACGDHPVGAGDLAALHLVCEGNQLVERELADADMQRIEETPMCRRPDCTRAGVIGSDRLTLATSKAGGWAKEAQASARRAGRQLFMITTSFYIKRANAGAACRVISYYAL